jgi:hypothetical protein
MGLYEGRGNLNKGLKDLMMRWQQTRQDWNDVVANEFEKRYLETTELALKQAINAMDQMAQTMQRIDSDCK